MAMAIYAGTFDPITNGHLDVIKRALSMFDSLVVAVSENPKKTLFSSEDRVSMITSALVEEDISGVTVESFSGLLVDYAKSKNCRVVIRGLRAISDFDNEFKMSLMNRKLGEGIETVFIMASDRYTFLSSSAVKEAASLGGDVSELVPDCVSEALKKKY